MLHYVTSGAVHSLSLKLALLTWVTAGTMPSWAAHCSSLGFTLREANTPFQQWYTNVWTYQKFKQPKPGFIIESFGGVDKKENHKSIKDEWIHVCGDDTNWSKETSQKAQAPQYPKESSNLIKGRKEKKIIIFTITQNLFNKKKVRKCLVIKSIVLFKQKTDFSTH